MESKETKELPEVAIAPATPEDIRGLREVQYATQLATYPNEDHGVTQEDIRRNLEGMFDEEDMRVRGESLQNSTTNERVLVAKSGDKVVGFATANSVKDVNELHALYVLPEFHGQGVGKQLWEQVSTVFDPTKDIILDVVSYNAGAIDFYKRLGFEETGASGVAETFILEDGSKIPTIQMVKRASVPIETELAQVVAENADSPENETLLLIERLHNTAVKEKFIAHLDRAYQAYREKHPEQGPRTKAEIREMLEDRMRVAQSFTEVDHGDSAPTSVDGLHLRWKSRSGKTPTTKEWSLIEAHEKGHQVRIIDNKYSKEYFGELFHDAVDVDAVPFPEEAYQEAIAQGETTRTREETKAYLDGYLRNPAEIIERMSQLKNYFGMRGNEKFTKAHLDYAREHYTKTRYDNDMTDLFLAITPEKEERFLELMNSVGV